MVASGMRDAGYVYVNIDDLWAAKERDASGSLAPDSAKFPSGLSNLSHYIHSAGLKFGLSVSHPVNDSPDHPVPASAAQRTRVLPDTRKCVRILQVH
jgi:hypothetical protein